MCSVQCFDTVGLAAEEHPACKKWWGWWRWALVGPDGVVPSQMVSVSASVNLPLHHKVQKFSSATGSPGWSQKKGRKAVVVVVWCAMLSVCAADRNSAASVSNAAQYVIKVVSSIHQLTPC